MDKLIFQSMIDSFGVSILLYPRHKEGGRYVGTEWVKDDLNKQEPIALSEPFIPSSLLSQRPVASNYRQGGRTEDFEMVWFSTQQVELKSQVVHNGITYSVEDSIPYTDYSDVTQYGCKTVSSHVKL